jgi:hypothetical protein
MSVPGTRDAGALRGLVPSFLNGAGDAPLGHVEILIARLGAIGRHRARQQDRQNGLGHDGQG